MKKIVSILSVLVIGFMLLSGCTGNKENGKTTVEEKSDRVEIGKAAPSFELKDLEGKDVSLESFKGKPVILNFWASWCGPCTSEMPTLEKLASENKDIPIIAINASESPEKAGSFIKKNGYNSLVVLVDETEEAAIKYMIQGIPTSVFIDKDGVVKSIIVGSRDEAAFLEEISKIK